MKKYLLIIFIGLLAVHHTVAQISLLPSIGISSLPSDSDPVCYIPMVSGSFYSNGLQPGDTAADFKLYNLSGDSVTLSGKLSTGKPVLMIAGSFTCPVFRNKVASINNVVNLYGNQLEVFVVYTLEAHPVIDTSVYFGYVNTGAANISQVILYRQPTTYGERKAVVQDFLSSVSLLAPVFIDGPCNNWWAHYGPAPNNAYLIDTTGVVFVKHGWYDKFPDNIVCDIDSLLGNPVTCGNQNGGGNFNFSLTSNDTIRGVPGSTITFSGELVNNSTSDVIVDIYRLQNNLPFGWASSLCADVCYPTTTDTATIIIPAGLVQQFHFYVYTDNAIDTSRARVGFRNRNNPNNQFARNLFGITEIVSSDANEMNAADFRIFPNPASELLYIFSNRRSEQIVEMKIMDFGGREILDLKDLPSLNLETYPINLPNLNNGAYFLKMTDASGQSVFKKFIVFR